VFGVIASYGFVWFCTFSLFAELVTLQTKISGVVTAQLYLSYWFAKGIYVAWSSIFSSSLLMQHCQQQR